MSGDQNEQDRDLWKVQATELARLATRMCEILDDQRRDDQIEAIESKARASGEKISPRPVEPIAGEKERQIEGPLDVALLRHFKETRQESRLLAEGRSPRTLSDRQKRIMALVAVAEYDLACALDAAQLNPSDTRLAESPSSIMWGVPRITLDPAPLMAKVYALQPMLVGLYEAREEVGALQNSLMVGSADASDSTMRSTLESRAKTLGELKEFAIKAGPLLAQLKFAASSKPEVRRELKVPPFVGMSPADFDVAVTDLLVNLRATGLCIEDLDRIAHGGTPDPPKDAHRALTRRLDRREAQRRAPTEK